MGGGGGHPRVHRSVETRQAWFPTGTVGPRVWIFLSPLNTNDGFYLSHMPIPTRGKDKKRTATRRPFVDQWHDCNVIWSHHVISQGFLAAFFMFSQYKIRYLVVSKKNNPLFVWGWDRKICPSWSLFGITRQASWCQSVMLGTVFLSHPHTHDGFLYSKTMIWISISIDQVQ